MSHLPPDRIATASLNGGCMSFKLGTALPFQVLMNKGQPDPISNINAFGTVFGTAIGFWFYNDGPSLKRTLFTYAGVNNLSKSGDSLIFSCASTGTSLTAADVLQPQTWHWIVITQRISSFLQGVQAIYVDGRTCASAPWILPAYGYVDFSIDTIDFLPSYDKFRDCAVSPLPALLFDSSYDASAGAWTQQEVAGLMGYFCVSAVPMTDKSGKNGVISLRDGAFQECKTPGLDVSWGGYAQPTDEGSLFGSNVTIQAWVYPEADVQNATILSCGQAGASENFLRLQMNAQEANGHLFYNVGVRQQLPSSAPDQVNTNFVIPAGEWVNVTLVRQGKSVSLYINGEWIKDGDITNANASSDPALIGATIAFAEGSYTNSFAGLIQSISVWQEALTSDQVRAAYDDSEPMLMDRRSSYYHFASLPVIDEVTLTPIALIGSAEIYDRTVNPNITELQASRFASVDPDRRERSDLLETDIEGIVFRALDHKSRDDERLVEVNSAFYASLIPNHKSSLEKRVLVESFEQELRGHLRAAEDDKYFPMNFVKHLTKNGKTTFYLRSRDGFVPIYDIVATVDECLNFKIDFAASAVFGFLGAVGVPTSISNSGKIKAVLTRAFKNKKVLVAITLALDGEITFRGVCAILKTFWTENLLQETLKASVTMSRWELFFFVISVTFTILDLVFPNPSTAAVYAFYVAKTVALVADLTKSWNGRPAGCMGNHDLSALYKPIEGGVDVEPVAAD